MAYMLTLMAAEELDGVHEARVERGGPAHPRRPGAPLRSGGQGSPGGRALERASLRLEVASPSGRVVAEHRRGETQAEARGLRAGARVCKEPYLAASFSVRRRRANWFCRRRLRHRRCVRCSGRRGVGRAYLEGEIR